MTPQSERAGTPSPRGDLARGFSAAIDAVRPESLVAARLSLQDGELRFDGRPLDPPVCLDRIGRIVVVGGGKAAAGMAAAIESLLSAGSEDAATRPAVSGLVSVPEGCGRPLRGIEIRETRPPTVNLPTPKVVEATREMLERLSSLAASDLAIAIVTGGGSALLAAPREGVSLEQKIAETRRLSEAGATIAELNVARRRLSAVKGGGLARACAAGRLLAVVLSDVVGSDLEVIASGPCMPGDGGGPTGRWTTDRGCTVEHLLVGDNAIAVHAAAAALHAVGYEVTVREASPRAAGESAEQVGRRLVAEGLGLVEEVARDGRPRAIVEGGETIVRVPPDHGTGGRNQQTVLAAIDAVMSSGAWPEGLAVASVGTDGEDGPTDAAGGLADAGVVAAILERRLDVRRAVERCDAYPLLDAAGGLVRTEPTGTNVADVRLVAVKPS
jgi:glycerate 2-kinase